jgi:hypothetical protein
MSERMRFVLVLRTTIIIVIYHGRLILEPHQDEEDVGNED